MPTVLARRKTASTAKRKFGVRYLRALVSTYFDAKIMCGDLRLDDILWSNQPAKIVDALEDAVKIIDRDGFITLHTLRERNNLFSTKTGLERQISYHTRMTVHMLRGLLLQTGRYRFEEVPVQRLVKE